MCNKYKEKSINFGLNFVKMSKEGEFGNPNVIDHNFSTKSVPT